MEKIVISFSRNPSGEGIKDTFEVGANEKSTVLEVLIQIYENQDSTLAFDHGCRVKNCGLCVVNVNGRPRFSCTTRIKRDAHISPLANLPLIKDLVFDREPFFHNLRRFQPYIVREKAPETEPEALTQPPEHPHLMSCRECFACLSSCPKFDHRNEAFGGPLGFVKLAQLHYDRRDHLDRVSQADEMGISQCVDCHRCNCIAGISIDRTVIKPFLQLLDSG